MRRLIAGGLVGLFLVAAALATGCGNTQSSTPKMIEPSKEGPQPLGGPKGKDGGSSNQ